MMHKLIVAWAVIAVGFAVPDDLTATPRWLNGAEGVCEAAPNNADGYTFKTSKGVQRCFYVRNLPASSGKSKNPVLIKVNGYSAGANAGSNTANRYGFTHIITAGEKKDGLGGFAMEFGNNNVVNDANLTPCADADSRDMEYVRGIFTFIDGHTDVLDTSKVFAEGFSQSSMWAVYMTVCFKDRMAGVWQGGSGLALTGYAPVVPGGQAQCTFENAMAQGPQDCTFCDDCKYWPVYPQTCGKKLVACEMAYTDDAVGCGTEYYMYNAMVAEGHDARMLSFTGGQHSDPKNAYAWKAGCLGLSEACTATCESSFATCVASSTFETCDEGISELVGCTSSCSPTLAMLKLSETPVVTLSQGNFGTLSGGSLVKHAGSAPKPKCTNDFGKRGVDGIKARNMNPSQIAAIPAYAGETKKDAGSCKAEMVVVDVKDNGIVAPVSGSSTTAFAAGLIAMLAAVATIV